MRFEIETMIFLAYLDSLFSETGAREQTTPLRAIPETLNRLYADAMREHARRSALLVREGAEWRPMPDWRLDRQVIRLGLYLRERLRVAAGERVALLSDLRPEWLIADLAALGVGAVSVAIDSQLQGNELAEVLEDAGPRVTFVSETARRLMRSLDGRAPRHGQLIAMDSTITGDGVLSLPTLLEMGGTLDTPERAQSYRADARSLAPDRPAIRHYRKTGGGWDRIELSQGEVIERLRAGWLRERARPGDLTYVSDPTVSLASRLALYAFLGDGSTTTALAPVGGELSDLAALHPTTIVASAELLAEAIRAGAAREDERPGRAGRWLSHAMRLVPLLGRARREQRAVHDILGGRVRWIGSTEPVDSTLAERLGVAVVGAAPI
jgi:long-chain acyl-CoA synthetase